MPLAAKNSMKVVEGHVETAVAVDTDKNSQAAIKWTAENLLKKNRSYAFVHVKTQNANSNDADFIPKGGRPPNDAEVKQFFLPFRGFCAQRGISTKEVVLHDSDVASALVHYVTTNCISHLVVGACSQNSIMRKFAATDIGKSVIKAAPDTCSVYIVSSKDKLQTVRYAKKVHKSPSSATTTPTGTPTKAHPSGIQSSPFLTTGPDTYDVTRSSASLGSRLSTSSDTSFSGQSNDFMSYSWQKTGIPMTGSPLKPRDASYISKSSFAGSTSEASNFSVLLSFQSSDSSFAASPPSGNSLASFSSHVSGNTDDEMAKLQLELKQSLSVYDMACQDVVAAEEKAREIGRSKTSQLQSMENYRPPRNDSWVTLPDVEKMKQRPSMMGHEMFSGTPREVDGRMRFSAMALDKTSEAGEEQPEPMAMSRMNVCYRRYTVEQVEEATEYFSDSRKIGEGGYGPVFKGTLDHTPVAIKILRPDVSQGLRQFRQEVEVLSCMRHPNMVLLVGACPEYGSLVYEYMENGNLEDRLFCKDGTLPIPWQLRFKIAAEIATGLCFLHQTKPEPLVHRDIKPSNILLDANYVSKIGDVGLARLVPVSIANKMTQYHMTAAAGTFCYIDPEYQQTGMLGVKSDVYSLGVVLLQMITARPPMGITMQVEDAIESGSFHKVLDQRIRDWPLEETMSLAKFALRCCELQKKDRPDLSSEVLPELTRLKNLGLQSGGGRSAAYGGIPQKQEPEIIEMISTPRQINVKGGRWHQRFKSMAGSWKLKSSFKKPRIFCATNRRHQLEKPDPVLVEGCWTFAGCSKSVPQLRKLNSFS